jgi:peptide/nickel transport system substrate-binding protein
VWSSAAKPDGIPDTIVWRFGGSDAAQIAAVERGKADVAFGFPESLFERIATRFASQLHTNPLQGTNFVFLNTHVPPFDDVRVRRALNYALDRNAIVDAFGGPEQAQPTCQVLPPNLPGYTPYCPYTANPTPGGTWSAPDLPRARRLIEASGTQGMTVSLWWTKGFPGYAAPRPIESLLRSLGYRVRLRTIDDAIPYLKRTGDTRNRVQAGAHGWFTDYQSAFGFLTVLSCRSVVPRSTAGNNINLAGFCDRRIERDITRALNLQTSDLSAANELWARIDRAITDRAPWLFLVNPKATMFVSERVGNFQHNPQWGVLLDQLWVR